MSNTFIIRAAAELTAGFSLTADASLAYLASLGIHDAVPVKMAVPSDNKKMFEFAQPVDFKSLERHLGKSVKLKAKNAKGRSVLSYTYFIAGKGKVTLYPELKRIVLTNEGDSFPLCTEADLRAFIGSTSPGSKIQGTQDAGPTGVEAGEVHTVRAYLRPDPANSLIKALRSKFDLAPVGGRDGGQGSNYRWSTYRFIHPKLGCMQLALDHPKAIVVITAFNTKKYPF